MNNEVGVAFSLQIANMYFIGSAYSTIVFSTCMMQCYVGADEKLINKPVALLRKSKIYYGLNTRKKITRTWKIFECKPLFLQMPRVTLTDGRLANFFFLNLLINQFSS
jgi:intergrase/recombinase